MPSPGDANPASSPDAAPSGKSTNQPLSEAKGPQNPNSKESGIQSGAQEGTSPEDSKDTASQPLAPPPKPSQNNNSNNQEGPPDYFSGNHGSNSSHFSLEPNPFEQSFGQSSAETPGKFSGLPSVASITSPAPLGPRGTPSWQDSLRSGPLSPAMLTGPTNNQSGYFDESFRNPFPTPNESSLRTGLTPGGGNSMFPAPSPNSQAIFNLQGGGGTPGTLEFQRTAMAAARNKKDASNTSNASNNNNNQNMNQNPQSVKQEYQPAQQPQQFSNQPENDAVNSLYMLANNGNRSANQFAIPNQQQQSAPQVQQHDEASPATARGSAQTGRGAGDEAEYDEAGDDTKPATRGRGKKGGSTSKASQASNGRRKAEETPTKAPAKKRSKGSTGAAHEMPPSPDFDDDDEGDDDDDDMGASPEQEGAMTGSGNKKMTDEEKRKNFLERNRVAALKCRQRKKQWLANLQTKVEIFTSENDALTAQCSQLREEIINLKTLLLAHKDCPVSHTQGLGGNNMVQFMGDINNNNPYGMAMQNGAPMMNLPNQGGMQRG